MPSSQVYSENMSEIRVGVWNGMGIQSITQVVREIVWREHWHGSVDDTQHRGGECEMFHDR